MKGIILDFNRTLFNPEKQELEKETLFLLDLLKTYGIKLALISVGGEKRKSQVAQISSFFDLIKIVEKKTIDDFKDIAKQFAINNEEIMVVGDRVKKEIKLGNQLGMTTIWLCKGKFANELPEGELEIPNKTVSTLNEVISFLNNKII